MICKDAKNMQRVGLKSVALSCKKFENSVYKYLKK